MYWVANVQKQQRFKVAIFEIYNPTRNEKEIWKQELEDRF